MALLASDRAVAYTRSLAAALGAPAFIVGVVLVSLGTDLPEMANSVAAHLQGEGDVNVGDSVGSALTQYTFVLGLFPLVAVIAIDRLQIGLISLLTMAGLGLTALLVSDGWLGRWDGVALVAAWAIFTAVVVRVLPSHGADDPRRFGIAAVSSRPALCCWRSASSALAPPSPCVRSSGSRSWPACPSS